MSWFYDLTIGPNGDEPSTGKFCMSADSVSSSCSREAAKAAQHILMTDTVPGTWQPMETAPLDRRVLLRRDLASGVGIGQFADGGFPYWTDDRGTDAWFLRTHIPTGWQELPE